MSCATFYQLQLLLQRDKQAGYISDSEQFGLKMASARDDKRYNVFKQKHGCKQNFVKILQITKEKFR